MNKEFILILIVISIIIAGGLFYFLYKRQSPQVNIQNNINDSKIESQDEILLELKKLNITVTGEPKQIELQLPSTLSDDGWDVKKNVCEEGGYNLSDYAGQTVSLTQYSTNEIFDNAEPLDVWVVSSGEKVVCVYKTVTKNSRWAPGVFSVKENPSIKIK